MRGVAGAAEAVLRFGFIIIPLRITRKTGGDLRTVPWSAEAEIIADEINGLSRQRRPARYSSRIIIGHSAPTPTNHVRRCRHQWACAGSFSAATPHGNAAAAQRANAGEKGKRR